MLIQKTNAIKHEIKRSLEFILDIICSRKRLKWYTMREWLKKALLLFK